MTSTKSNTEEKSQFKESLQKKSNELDKIEKILNSDPELSTLINLFGDFLQQPNFKAFGEMMSKLSITISSLYKNIPTLSSIAGPELIKGLYLLINTFSDLLIKTKKIIVDVIEQADIQKDNCKEMVDIVEAIDGNKVVDNDDWQECLDTLSEWICQENLDEILQEWTSFVKKCEEEKQKWDEKFEKANTTERKGLKIGLKVFGCCLLAAGTAVAVICAAPAVFGLSSLVAAAGVIELGAFSGVSILYGAVMLRGSTAIDVHDSKIAKKIYDQSQKVKQSISEMLSYGEKMKKDLNDLDTIKSKQMTRHLNILKNKKTRTKINKAISKIVTYLDNYIDQGNKIVKDINDCQNDLVKRLKQLYL